MNAPILADAEVFAGFGVLLIIAGLIFALVWICFPVHRFEQTQQADRAGGVSGEIA
ncbi:MAG TPA: hypothetical protein VFD66_07025 [Verrucomicrobiae bacterium]|nr:hypothetical protein [Verrucomicrobiae bacterium]